MWLSRTVPASPSISRVRSNLTRPSAFHSKANILIPVQCVVLRGNFFCVKTRTSVLTRQALSQEATRCEMEGPTDPRPRGPCAQPAGGPLTRHRAAARSWGRWGCWGAVLGIGCP